MTAAKMNISSTDTLTSAGEPKRFLLAAGGTGGHVYPAIAIAEALKNVSPDSEFLFVGTKDRMEWETVPRYGFQIKSIWISGFHRSITIKNLLFPIKLFVSLIQSLLIIRSYKPDVVISCGGFASGPIGWVAAKSGIPLILQEQNSYPGVTTKLLAKYASIIFTAFEHAAEYLPADKIILSGNPVRGDFENPDLQEALDLFKFTSERSTLLVLGGSGGAKAINQAMTAHIDRLHDEMGLQIIWQCGKNYVDELLNKVNTSHYPNLRLQAYIHDMSSAYRVADLVVTRSGAGTCSELMNLGQPAIMVPSPNVAGDHQRKNAESIASFHAALLIDESQLEAELADIVSETILNEEKLLNMQKAMLKLAKPNAAKTISKEILSFVNRIKS
tara:strand:- start:23545 stop:24705 length:1161 start_codon:yes stop_codon:yes gene_type:complete